MNELLNMFSQYCDPKDLDNSQTAFPTISCAATFLEDYFT